MAKQDSYKIQSLGSIPSYSTNYYETVAGIIAPEPNRSRAIYNGYNLCFHAVNDKGRWVNAHTYAASRWTSELFPVAELLYLIDSNNIPKFDGSKTAIMG